MDLAATLVIVGGPLIYLLGNSVYKVVVYGWVPPSHIAGIVLLALLFPAAFMTDRLMVGALASVALIVVAVWQSLRAPSVPVGSNRRWPERRSLADRSA